MAQTQHDLQSITDFIVDRAGYYLDMPLAEIDPDRSLGDYGVDSVYLMSIVSDLEEELDLDLDLAELAEVRTVNELATSVATKVSPA